MLILKHHGGVENLQHCLNSDKYVSLRPQNYMYVLSDENYVVQYVSFEDVLLTT
jgi:hypothetical protein